MCMYPGTHSSKSTYPLSGMYTSSERAGELGCTALAKVRVPRSQGGIQTLVGAEYPVESAIAGALYPGTNSGEG